MKVFLDGTGDQTTPFIGLAGLAAPAETWALFEASWATVLKSFGVPHSHMTDLNRRKRAFKCWSEDRVIDFVKQLLRVLYGGLLSQPHFRFGRFPSLDNGDRQKRYRD